MPFDSHQIREEEASEVQVLDAGNGNSGVTDPNLRGAAESYSRWSRARRRILPTVVILLWRLGIVAVILVIWWLLVGHVIPLYDLPRLSSIWSSIRQQGPSSLLHDVGVTLQEAFVGYVVGVVAGIVGGFILAFMARAAYILNPFITMFNSVPRIALAPLFIVWFGLGMRSKEVFVASIVLFPVLINTMEGARDVDAEILTVSRLLGATRLQLVRKVMLPSVMPWIITSMRLSIAFALNGAVIGELFAGQAGLGYLIAAGSGVFDLGEIFAAVGIVTIIALVLDILAKWGERRLLKWRPEIPLG